MRFPALLWPTLRPVLGLWLALTTAAVLPLCAHAAIVARGVVTTADGSPVRAAEIAVNGRWLGVVTGVDGRFALPSLRPGTLRLGVRHEQYAMLEQSFEIREGDSPSWTFVLSPRAPEPLPDLPRRRVLLHTELQGAFKLPVETREFPQRATVVPRDALRDREAFRVHEAVRGVAGVIALPDDGRGALDVQFRGQGALGSDRVLRDADPVPAGVPLDLVGLERVEFLRGPGSAFEGATGLGGGTVATVGKRPRLEPGSELRIAADSWGRIRSVADHSASLGTRRSTYRVSAGHERTADHRDGRPDGQGLTLAPVFAIPVGERAHLQIQGDYLRRTFTRDPGLPLAKASLGVPAERFLGESQDEVTAESGIAQLELMLYPEGDLQLRQALSYQGALTRGRVVELTGLTGAGQVTRRSRESNQRVHAFRSQSELHRQLHMGRVEHALIAGLEFTNGLSAGESSVDSLASTALAAPRQGSSAVAVGARQGFRAPARGVALYAQDLLRLHARWRLLVSGRWQHHALERSSGSDAGALAAPVSNENSRTVSGATGRAGLVFQPTQRGRVFVLAGHSFDPSWSHAERGDVPGLLRTRATQYEIGWKQESANGRLDWSASAYALRQRDVRALRPFLAAGPYSWRIGEQTTTGLEFDAAGSLGNDLRVTFGYAYQHARVTDPGEAGIADGTRLPMAPRHHATLWAVYRVPSGTFAGLDLGAGLVAQSERTSALVGGPVLEGFQEYDAMVGYGRRRWQAQLQVRNLTDTQAFDAVPGDHLVARDPRSVRGSMLVRF